MINPKCLIEVAELLGLKISLNNVGFIWKQIWVFKYRINLMWFHRFDYNPDNWYEYNLIKKLKWYIYIF
jgi:hypothetical protein